ncbi:MAG TPA: RpiB/LacA/LacB family sugar-phosphate isomerase [Candidatus Babeliales bacterium]|nr:RpiB/LacA/LacB family sugar-phosphate isomerase [Candidatus Babeliales bacterium]
MKIGIGADHRGYELKKYLIEALSDIEWFDVGTGSDDRTDYPLYVPPVIDALKKGSIDCGILICGSGVGMSIVANRYKGIYAALVWNEKVAVQSKEHDNSNVLVLPSDYITSDQARDIVSAWLKAKFMGGRYQERLTLFE